MASCSIWCSARPATRAESINLRTAFSSVTSRHARAATLAATLGLSLAAACRHSTPQPRTQSVERRVHESSFLREPRTRMDSMLRQSTLRSDSVDALVDTIVTAPAALRYRVGDSVSLGRIIVYEARDSAGHALVGFTPMFSVEPLERVTIHRGGWVYARSPGDGYLVVRAMRFHAGKVAPSGRPITRVPIHIDP